MTREWKCWTDEISCEEDADDVLGCLDAEEAAREYVGGLIQFPDWQDRIDGDPFVVHVISGTGERSRWSVRAVASVDVHAEEIEG